MSLSSADIQNAGWDVGGNGSVQLFVMMMMVLSRNCQKDEKASQDFSENER